MDTSVLFYFILFLWEREGMRHAPSRLGADVEDSIRARQIGLGPLDGSVLPPKTPLRRCTGCIPLCEVDLWTRYWIELGQFLLRPQLSEFLLRLYFLVFFHEARRVPALCY